MALIQPRACPFGVVGGGGGRRGRPAGPPARVEDRSGRREPAASRPRDAAALVQAIARHAHVDITMAIYAHTNLDALRQALDAIEWEDL